MAKFIENTGAMNTFMDNIQKKMVNTVEKRAKELAPQKTGRLKRSIKASKVSNNHWKVEANTDYATYVELGTSRMRAQPFLRPALNALRKFTR